MHATSGPSAVSHYNLGLVQIASGHEKKAEQTYATAVAQYGMVEGERIGAVGGLRALLSTEHKVVAQRILQRYWPERRWYAIGPMLRFRKLVIN